DHPLDPSTTYTVSATFGEDNCATTPRFTGSSSFTTAAQPPASSLLHVDDIPDLGGGLSEVGWRIDDPLTRGTGTVCISSDYVVDMPDAGWSSGNADFSSPPPGKHITVAVRNDPFTIGSTTWPATTVQRTFNGPPATGAGSGGT